VTVDPGESGSPTGSGNIQSVVRAADILRLLTQDHVSSISVAEASKALGLQRPTTHRYMSTLVSVQLLQRDLETGRFVLGPLAHELFAAILSERRVLTIAPSRMQALADRVSMSAALCLWDGSAALVSHVSFPRPGELAVRTSVGFRVAPTGAQTILFLAFMKDQRQVQAALERMTAEEAALVQDLMGVARSDHFVSIGGDEDGIRIIAAPIFDAHGICATMALLSTTRRLPPSPLSGPATALRETASLLSADLLGEPRPELVTPAG
jgi:DNA-binding IclR family transcriptional regulator